MWIKIGNDLINLATVKFISLSRGQQNKFVVYFLQGEETTVHIPFDREEDAIDALNKIEQIVQVEFRLPSFSESASGTQMQPYDSNNIKKNNGDE